MNSPRWPHRACAARITRVEAERDQLRAEVERLRAALTKIARAYAADPIAVAVVKNALGEAIPSAAPSEGEARPEKDWRALYHSAARQLGAIAESLGNVNGDPEVSLGMVIELAHMRFAAPDPQSPSEAKPATICARCGALWSDKVNTACDGWLLPHDWMPSPSSGQDEGDRHE